MAAYSSGKYAQMISDRSGLALHTTLPHLKEGKWFPKLATKGWK